MAGGPSAVQAHQHHLACAQRRSAIWSAGRARDSRGTGQQACPLRSAAGRRHLAAAPAVGVHGPLHRPAPRDAGRVLRSGRGTPVDRQRQRIPARRIAQGMVARRRVGRRLRATCGAQQGERLPVADATAGSERERAEAAARCRRCLGPTTARAPIAGQRSRSAGHTCPGSTTVHGAGQFPGEKLDRRREAAHAA